jgi:hypothetical protein
MAVCRDQISVIAEVHSGSRNYVFVFVGSMKRVCQETCLFEAFEKAA